MVQFTDEITYHQGTLTSSKKAIKHISVSKFKHKRLSLLIPMSHNHMIDHQNRNKYVNKM